MARFTAYDDQLALTVSDRFDGNSGGRLFLVAANGVGVELTYTFAGALDGGGACVLKLHQPLSGLYRALQMIEFSPRRAVFLDPDENVLHEEDVTIDASVSGRLFDPLTAQSHTSAYVRPEPLAIFTHVHNEGWMLKVWQDHYSKECSLNCLYVLDDGSSDGSLGYLSRDVNVIRVPRGKLDHWNMANYCSYFARFLGQRYEWVIGTDCDELLFFPAPAVQYLRAIPVEFCVIAPERAVAPVHDEASEPAFDYGNYQQGLKSRRHYVREDDMFLKPLISRGFVTWGPGSHGCAEPVHVGEGVLLLHAKHVDLDRLADSTENWRKSDQTLLDRRFFVRLDELNGSGASSTDYARELLATYRSRPAADLPVFFKSRFTI